MKTMRTYTVTSRGHEWHTKASSEYMAIEKVFEHDCPEQVLNFSEWSARLAWADYLQSMDEIRSIK